MSVYKRGNGKVYWYKFMFGKKLIRASSKTTNKKEAAKVELKHRNALLEEKQEKDRARERLACAEVLRCHQCEKLFNAAKAVNEAGNIFCDAGCRSTWERKQRRVPKLAAFLKASFLPFCETKHSDKAKTLAYYKTGSASLCASEVLRELRLDEITDQHAQQYAASLSHLSASTINCGLRTLRRAIYLAAEWGTIERRPKITLQKGERQRDRVLSDAEVKTYLEACEQPWRDAATIMLGTGMRPGEAFALRWDHILFGSGDGLIQITQGKSKAAKRVLPMVPVVRELLLRRWSAAGEPSNGWVFPSNSACGHLDSNTAKNQHGRALKQIKREAHPEFSSFEPYCLRHTALTRLGESGCDVFTLARIAGHSNITITMRYVHPQAEAIERAFAKFSVGAQAKRLGQGAELGTHKNLPLSNVAAGTV